MSEKIRLVNIDLIISEFDEYIETNREQETYANNFCADVCDVLKKTILEVAPIVNAVEVVHGQWLTDRFGLDRSICSVCDACYEGDGGNYCRRCGAKMDA